jgi:hypothetical protein
MANQHCSYSWSWLVESKQASSCYNLFMNKENLWQEVLGHLTTTICSLWIRPVLSCNIKTASSQHERTLRSSQHLRPPLQSSQTLRGPIPSKAGKPCTGPTSWQSLEIPVFSQTIMPCYLTILNHCRNILNNLASVMLQLYLHSPNIGGVLQSHDSWGHCNLTYSQASRNLIKPVAQL